MQNSVYLPYRLEMQAKLPAAGCKNLYDFWGSRLYFELTQNDKSILNLASKEYSKVIEKYLTPEVEYVSCIFGIWQDGKVKVKATEAKMARGEMVRWCAEHNILHIEDTKKFDRLGYKYQKEQSTAKEFVFLKN